MDTNLCLLCRVGLERLALRADDIEKVVAQPLVTPLPRLPRAIAGISHHHGRIVTVIDAAAALFGGAPMVLTPDARMLVLDRPARHLGVLVDSVEQIQPLRLSAELPPGPVPALRVAQHAGRGLFAVDAERLLELVQRLGLDAA